MLLLGELPDYGQIRFDRPVRKVNYKGQYKPLTKIEVKQPPSMLQHIHRGVFMSSEGNQIAFYRPD